MGREESYLCDILRIGEKGGQDILKGTVTRHVTQIEPKQFGLQPLGESAKSDLRETNYGFGFTNRLGLKHYGNANAECPVTLRQYFRISFLRTFPV